MYQKPLLAGVLACAAGARNRNERLEVSLFFA